MLRSLPALLTLFFVSLALGCGGGGGPTDPGDGDDGGDPPPPANEAPTADLSASEEEGLAPLETTVELTCSDPDGTIAEYRLDTDGDGGFEIVQEQAITETLTLQDDATVGGQCTDDDGDDSPLEEVSLSVIQPATLTVHLRNLTQDGEPFVRDEGEITYVVGPDTLTSADSVVVERVDPREAVEIWATHDAFYADWGLVKDDGQGPFERRAYRDLEQTASTVSVEEGGSARMFVYKIRRADIEGEGFTMADVATVIDNRVPQGTDRYVERELTAWIDRDGSDATPPSDLEGWVNTVLTSDGDDGLRSLTDGYLTSIPIQDGGSEPERPYIQIIYQQEMAGNGSHAESVDDETNEITFSQVKFDVNFADKSTVLEELGQSLGLRDDIGGALSPEITRQGQEYNRFGHILGKLLYWFPPGTHFERE